MTTTAPTTYVPEDALDELRAQLRGTAIASGDPDYASVREVFNAMHVGRPDDRGQLFRHGRRRRTRSTSPASTACWSRCAAEGIRLPGCPRSTAAC